MTAIVANSPRSTHAIDVSGFEDQAVRSLMAHKKYLEGLGDHPMADPDCVRVMLQESAMRLAGSHFAVPVEVFHFGS